MRDERGDLCIDLSLPTSDFRAALAEAHRLETAQLPIALELGEDFVPLMACEPLRSDR